MEEPIVPAKLRPGDTLRVIAPSLSRGLVLEHDHSAIAADRFERLGLRLTFGAHVDERDAFDSSSIASRVADLHDAFRDPEVQGILTVIGGFNANELLPHLDFDLIRTHPKVFCGYSDITALQNAMLARAGLVTYSGPHWSTFGMRDHFDRTLGWFEAALLEEAPIDLEPSGFWTDDSWFLDQDARVEEPDDGWWSVRSGSASGRLVGGNLCTFNLLQGTAYRPSLEGAILLVEDDEASTVADFARNLTSLLQLPDAAALRGLAIGRFQRGTGMTRDLLVRIIDRQPLPVGAPVLANLDFGHTSPLMTVPVGGTAELVAGSESRFRIIAH